MRALLATRGRLLVLSTKGRRSLQSLSQSMIQFILRGLLLSAAAACYLIQPVARYLADRLDPVHVIFAGLALSVGGVFLVPFTVGPVLVGVLLCGGRSVGTVWTNTDAMVSNLAHRGRMAATRGVAGSFKELGNMLGPLLIGRSLRRGA